MRRSVSTAIPRLGVDSSALRQRMTGVRGGSAKEKLAQYNDDMRAMLHEVARVRRPGAKPAFVIGNATVDRAEYTTTEDMAGWGLAAGLERERELRKTVHGLYSVSAGRRRSEPPGCPRASTAARLCGRHIPEGSRPTPAGSGPSATYHAALGPRAGLGRPDAPCARSRSTGRSAPRRRSARTRTWHGER